MSICTDVSMRPWDVISAVITLNNLFMLRSCLANISTICAPTPSSKAMCYVSKMYNLKVGGVDSSRKGGWSDCIRNVDT